MNGNFEYECTKHGNEWVPPTSASSAGLVCRCIDWRVGSRREGKQSECVRWSAFDAARYQVAFNEILLLAQQLIIVDAIASTKDPKALTSLVDALTATANQISESRRASGVAGGAATPPATGLQQVAGSEPKAEAEGTSTVGEG